MIQHFHLFWEFYTEHVETVSHNTYQHTQVTKPDHLLINCVYFTLGVNQVRKVYT